MKKKILVLGLILAAAFVLFTSCEQMLTGEDFTFIGVNLNSGRLETLRITKFDKVLRAGLWSLNSTDGKNYNGMITVYKSRNDVVLTGGMNQTINIDTDKNIVIDSTYKFNISDLLK